MCRVVGADGTVHFLRGEGYVEIVGDECGAFIRQVEVGYTPRHHFSTHGVYTPRSTPTLILEPRRIYTTQYTRADSLPTTSIRRIKAHPPLGWAWVV